MLVHRRREITIGERVGELAAEHPDAPAVISLDADGTETVLTWARLEAGTNVAARRLGELGVDETSVVAISLPTCLDHVVASIAAWKLGAVVLPLDPGAAPREMEAIVEVAAVRLRIGRGAGAIDPGVLHDAGTDSAPLPRRGTPRSAHGTGGSTGRQRIVLREKPWVYDPANIPSPEDLATGVDVGQVQLVLLPLHHTGFTRLHHGLVLDHLIVLPERFVPALVPRAIEKYRVNNVAIVPSMMRTILTVPNLSDYDLSSIEAIHHGAAPCPEPAKRAWIDLLGPEKVWDGYSSQERIGAVWIRGDEWLEHPGSVGRSADCQVRIVTEDGGLAAPGEIGTIFLKSRFTKQPTYLGPGESLREHDGFMTLGDLGYVDEEGYLYLVGRSDEMINVGGAKVYPAEVEEVLLAREDVRDAVVVGRAHEHLGQSVHAIVASSAEADRALTAELDEYCRSRLSLAKVPLSYEFVDEIPRTQAGKLRRSALA